LPAQLIEPNKIQDDAIVALLLASLQRTIDFLKYAEAKNGALLTFSSAWVLAILNIVLNDKPIKGLLLYEYTVIPPFILAGLAALISFFPRMHLPGFLGGRRAGPHPKNLLYFGDVGLMTVSEFQNAVRDNYYPQDARGVTDAYIRDLTVQIAVNSQITNRKLRLFQIGLWLVMIAGIAFVSVTAMNLYHQT
jgi:Family of unknown function (DUF5706)